MVRWLLAVCLMTAVGFGRAGEFADTMEDELIFLPDDNNLRPPAPVAPPATFAAPTVVPAAPIAPTAPVAPAAPAVTTAPGGAGYDRLPRFFREMNEYDRIAMSPYEHTYDSMPMREKAELYSRQFEYMHNRRPNFSPRTLEEIAASGNAFEAKKYLYKPPPQKKPREAGKTMDLGALPGPWSQNAPPAPPPAPAGDGEGVEYYQNPDGSVSVPPDRRLESLRGNWNIGRRR